jgi:hypothetical protein
MDAENIAAFWPARGTAETGARGIEHDCATMNPQLDSLSNFENHHLDAEARFHID